MLTPENTDRIRAIFNLADMLDDEHQSNSLYTIGGHIFEAILAGRDITELLDTAATWASDYIGAEADWRQARDYEDACALLMTIEIADAINWDLTEGAGR